MCSIGSRWLEHLWQLTTGTSHRKIGCNDGFRPNCCHLSSRADCQYADIPAAFQRAIEGGTVDATTFARASREERDAMLASYSDANSGAVVATLIRDAALTPEQKKLVLAALDTAVADAFYTVLVALDGGGSLGGNQQSYSLRDELGNVVSSGDGRLEAAAWQTLQSGRD